MKVFRVIRLSLWALIFALAIVVVGLYVGATQTILSKPQLMTWAQQGKATQAMRDSMLTPRIITAVQNSEPAGFQLLPPHIIQKSLDEALPPTTLAKFTPSVVNGVYSWLDSRHTTIAFSIPISSTKDAFFAALSRNLASEMAKLPACSWQNSSADISDGVCTLDATTSAQIRSSVTSAIEDNASNIFGSSVTANDLLGSDGSSGTLSSIPDYLNILYAAALFMGGLGIITGLWLLLRKRLAGLIALGAGTIIGGGVLVSIGLFASQMVKRLAAPAAFYPLRSIVAASLRHTIVTLGVKSLLVGLGLALVGSLGLFAWRHSHPAKKAPVHHKAAEPPHETIAHHL